MRQVIPLVVLVLASSPARSIQPGQPVEPAESAESAQPAAERAEAVGTVSPALSAEELLRRATAALEAGDPKSAAMIYAELRRQHPEYPSGWFGSGLAAEASGDFGSALGFLGRAAELDPERAAVQLARGRILARSGVTNSALSALAKSRTLDPAQPDGYLFAALLLRDAGRYAEAEALLRSGISLARPRREFWDQLGLVLLSQQRPGDALAAVEDYLSRYSATPRVELVRGLALAEDPERRDAAIVSLELAVSGGEGGAQARIRLAELLMAGDRLDDAIARLEEAAEMAPAEPQAHYLLGQALQQAGRREEGDVALSRFRELRQQRDAATARAKRLGISLNVAIEHIQADRLSEALTAVHEILTEAPDHARTLALEAKILFSTGDLAGAQRAAIEARSNDPANAEHHYLEGLFAYHLGDLGVAESALARALAIDPDIGETHEVAAIVAYRLDRPAEAVAHFERAIRLGTDHEELRRVYALALEAAGRGDSL